MKNKNWASFFLILTISTLVQAKVFRNAYIAFEMPDEWNCTLEQTEWVCRSTKEPDSKEAIIILAAKEVGPTDSFALYETHLNSPIFAATAAKSAQSQPVYKAKYVQINSHQWLDGLHNGSEVPNYFTRYLATIKNRIAVLVTFSAHKNFYAKYSSMFHNAIMSMNIIASRDLSARTESSQIRPGQGTLGQTINPAIPADMYNDAPTEKSGGGLNLILGFLLIAGAIAGFFYYKKKT